VALCDAIDAGVLGAAWILPRLAIAAGVDGAGAPWSDGVGGEAEIPAGV